MSVKDMISFAPTLAVMSMIAFYREDVFCLWGCNPQIQAINESVRVYYATASRVAEQQAQFVLNSLATWYSTMPEINREVVMRWLQTNLTRIPQMDTATLGIYLYLVYTAAFTIILYIGLVADARQQEEEEEREKRVRIKPVARRPITRSMTRGNLTQSASLSV